MKTTVSLEVTVTDISPVVCEVIAADGVFNILTLCAGVDTERTADIPLGEIQALIDALIVVRDTTSRAAAGGESQTDTRVTLIDRDGDEWRPVPGDSDLYSLFIKGSDEGTSERIVYSIDYIRRMYSPLRLADNGEPFA